MTTGKVQPPIRSTGTRNLVVFLLTKYPSDTLTIKAGLKTELFLEMAVETERLLRLFKITSSSGALD